jgi:hypothetical protein
MSDLATGGLVKALDTVLSLWDRSVALLFALFGICCTLLGAAVCAWWLGDPDYVRSYGTLLGVGAVLFGGLAIARVVERAIERRGQPSFNFFPDDGQSHWQTAEQQDGSTHTQISLRFRATNLARRSLMPSRATLKRPILWGCRPSIFIATEDRLSGLYNLDTLIAAGATRYVELEFTVPKKIGKAGFPLDVKAVIEDQRGRRNILHFKRVRPL